MDVCLRCSLCGERMTCLKYPDKGTEVQCMYCWWKEQKRLSVEKGTGKISRQDGGASDFTRSGEEN
jgi:hypothetical protein